MTETTTIIKELKKSNLNGFSNNLSAYYLGVGCGVVKSKTNGQ
ncbi:hypothetical protein [Candidatus Nitrosocosmicus franklandus]|nr:hypothetical protein [Candidatus Nitrosocosmicus franklandus]